jgi:hypothetical protein
VAHTTHPLEADSSSSKTQVETIQYSSSNGKSAFLEGLWRNRSNDGQVVRSHELCRGRHREHGSDIGRKGAPLCVAGALDVSNECICDDKQTRGDISIDIIGNGRTRRVNSENLWLAVRC